LEGYLDDLSGNQRGGALLDVSPGSEKNAIICKQLAFMGYVCTCFAGFISMMDIITPNLQISTYSHRVLVDALKAYDDCKVVATSQDQSHHGR